MRGRLRWYLLLLLSVCAVAGLWVGGASAQGPGPYDCAVQILAGGAFDAHCEPAATATATSTSEPTVTATETLTPVVIVTATSTPTSAPPPPAPVGGLVANVPLLMAPGGDPALDANNWTIISAGSISPDGGYVQARLVGLRDGLRVYVQMMTPQAAGGFAIQVGAWTQTVTYKATAGWSFGERCGAAGCRGWTASALVPWADLGGLPMAGDVWPLTLQGAGGAWAGTLHWGLPDYAGRAAEAGAQVLTVPLLADSMVGGGTDCGAPDHPDYFPTTHRAATAVSAPRQFSRRAHRAPTVASATPPPGTGAARNCNTVMLTAC